jgi:hypothetical protein
MSAKIKKCEDEYKKLFKDLRAELIEIEKRNQNLELTIQKKEKVIKDLEQ